MTTSWPPQNLPTSTQRHDPLAVIAAIFIAGTAVLTLVVMAITFSALAVALPLAEQLGPWISARDLTIAHSISQFAWAFAGLAFACAAAAFGLTVATVRWMLPTRTA